MSRDRLVSMNMSALVRDQHVVGVRTNPTILHKAITTSDVYDEQIGHLTTLQIPVAEAIRLLTTHDVRSVCDLLRPVYENPTAPRKDPSRI
jgi:transaldolase